MTKNSIEKKKKKHKPEQTLQKKISKWPVDI